MNFVHHDLGQARRGDHVRVSLSVQANVHLVDNVNYQRYRRSQSFRSIGGRALKSPMLVTIPHDGHWHVVIDLGPGGGRVATSAQVIPYQAGATR